MEKKLIENLMNIRQGIIIDGHIASYKGNGIILDNVTINIAPEAFGVVSKKDLLKNDFPILHDPKLSEYHKMFYWGWFDEDCNSEQVKYKGLVKGIEKLAEYESDSGKKYYIPYKWHKACKCRGCKVYASEHYLYFRKDSVDPYFIFKYC